MNEPGRIRRRVRPERHAGHRAACACADGRHRRRGRPGLSGRCAVDARQRRARADPGPEATRLLGPPRRPWLFRGPGRCVGDRADADQRQRFPGRPDQLGGFVAGSRRPGATKTGVGGEADGQSAGWTLNGSLRHVTDVAMSGWAGAEAVVEEVIKVRRQSEQTPVTFRYTLGS